jgi:proteasome lid subunit RPN8/RPN11
VNIPDKVLSEIRAHAEAAYPEECCGVVFSTNENPDQLVRARRCINVQDKLHAVDATKFPRTNRNGYFIDPADLLAIEHECRERNESIHLIYHSHPDADAYFSKEDQRRAIVDGEPLHSGVSYLVISVKGKAAESFKLFTWKEELQLFNEQEVRL